MSGSGPTTLHQAVNAGNVQVLKKLLAGGAKVEERDKDGNTPLRLARDSATAKILLANGANLHAKNNDGLTPLHRAADSPGTELVELYISRGADVNAVSSSGFTPIMFAAWSGSDYKVAVLLMNGADPAAVANDGRKVFSSPRAALSQRLLLTMAATSSLANDVQFASRASELRRAVVDIVNDTVFKGSIAPKGLDEAPGASQVEFEAWSHAVRQHEMQVNQRMVRVNELLQQELEKHAKADPAFLERLQALWNEIQSAPPPSATERGQAKQGPADAQPPQRTPWWKVW